MSFETVLLEKGDGIATITLNRPKSMNALNAQLLREVDQIVTDIENDDSISVVVIAGAEKFFAAGADITEINTVNDPLSARRFLKPIQDTITKVEDMGKPVIAVICGFALGGGCELALACDIRIAAENAMFALPEVKIGVIPGGGGTQRLPRIVGAGRAKELMYTGDMIDAQEAYRIGLVNKVYPLATVMEEARKLAIKIAKQPRAGVAALKHCVNQGMNMDVKNGIAYEARSFEILFSTEDRAEGIKAFVEKRKPVYKNK